MLHHFRVLPFSRAWTMALQDARVNAVSFLELFGVLPFPKDGLHLQEVYRSGGTLYTYDACNRFQNRYRTKNAAL